jgi:hypothetical protein
MCGNVVDVVPADALRWRLAEAAGQAPAVRITFREAMDLPPPRGERLFHGASFDIWERPGELELVLRDDALGPCILAQLALQDATVTVTALATATAAELVLRNEVLPELLLTHLAPLWGHAYLHASGTRNRRGVRLFLGRSGAGKSTAAGLLCAEGDAPFCTDRCTAWVDGRPRTAAAPWHGGSGGEGASEALDACFVLNRHGPQGATRLTGMRALESLTANAFLPRWWPRGLDAGLQALERVAAEAPVYSLGSEPDRRLVHRVWEVSP